MSQKFSETESSYEALKDDFTMKEKRYSVFYENTVETNEIIGFDLKADAVKYAKLQVKGLKKYDHKDNTGRNNHERWFVSDKVNSTEYNPTGDIIYETDYYYNK